MRMRIGMQLGVGFAVPVIALALVSAAVFAGVASFQSAKQDIIAKEAEHEAKEAAKDRLRSSHGRMLVVTKCPYHDFSSDKQYKGMGNTIVQLFFPPRWLN